MNIVVGLAGLLACTPDLLITELVTGHGTNFERIRTMRAVFDFSSQVDGSAGGLRSTGLVYLRDPSGVLVRDGVEGRKMTEHALHDGETRRLGRTWSATGTRPLAFASRLRSEGYLSNINLLRTMGGAFNGNDLRPHDLGAVVAESDPPASAARSTRDGTALIRLTRHGNPVKGRPHRSVDWFDPARGYALVRSEWAGEDGTSASEWSDFSTSPDGVWFPKRHVLQARLNSENLRAETTITALAINQPLPAGSTTLSLPAGTVVKDELRGTEYKGNPDWTPAGPEKKWQPLVVPAAVAPDRYMAPTSEEPVSRTGWLLYAAGGLVAVGLGGLVARKLQAVRAGRTA